MEEKKSENCNCGCGCKKTGTYLLAFLLITIVLLLSGIFYTMQGLVSMCAAGHGKYCASMKGPKTMMCPLTGKELPAPQK